MIRLWPAAAVLACCACSDPTPPPAPDSVRPARLHSVGAQQNASTLRYVGEVAPANTVDMGFDIDGTLARIPIREGERVRRGDLLAELDLETLRLTVDSAQTALSLAEQDRTRLRTLRAQEMIPQSQLDEAETRADLLAIALEQAREQLADATLLAPFDAVIIRRLVERHGVVKRADPVLRLMPADALDIVAAIPEQRVATLTPAQIGGLYARFSADPQRRWPIRVNEYAAEANPDTQTFDVRFVLEQTPPWRVLPGMTAVIEIDLSDSQPMLQVPLSAVQSDPEGELFVWRVMASDMSVHKAFVTVGLPDGNSVSVLNGLDAGDQVVSAGGQWLLEGMRVRELHSTSP